MIFADYLRTKCMQNYKSFHEQGENTIKHIKI